MVNAVGEQGALGLTAVANSREDAEALYRKTVDILDAEAKQSLLPSGCLTTSSQDQTSAAIPSAELRDYAGT